MPNLFGFGCSFTNFKYPTYFDYMSDKFDNAYNFGFPGSGNKSIFNKICFLLHKNEIKENDYVTIQWSALAREDLMIRNKWIGGGLITNTPIFGKEYVENYFSVNQKAHELLSYIITINALLKERKINFKWFYMLEPWVGEMLGEPGEVPDELVQQYVETFQSQIVSEIKNIKDENYLGSIEGFILDNGFLNFRNQPTYYYEDENNIHQDDHPSQYCHYLFSKKILEGFNISETKNDDFLYDNSLQWTEYITNKDVLYETEYNHQKTFGHKLEYFENQHPTLKWPSNNITREK